MSDTFGITVNGQSVEAQHGETVLEAASRLGVHIPTLCHDPRLEPSGACRMCLVEVSGQRRLQPACLFQATPGMEVVTESDRIEKHRAVLLSLYLADHPLDEDGLPVDNAVKNDLRTHAIASRPGLIHVEPISSPRAERVDDNPYIGFDAEKCILCARCTRYCDEIEAVSAIQLVERGGHTTIGTVGSQDLLDSTCELCGGCIATCPTGAMYEKKSPQEPVVEPMAEKLVRTTCNFCGVGCQFDLRVRDERVVAVEAPPPGTTMNDGNLCVKGRFAFDFIHHEERLTTPLIRREDGTFREASWEEALDVAAKGLVGIKEKYGSDALGFVSSSRCTGEENYLMQKIARAAFGTNNCHQCAAT